MNEIRLVADRSGEGAKSVFDWQESMGAKLPTLASRLLAGPCMILSHGKQRVAKR